MCGPQMVLRCTDRNSTSALIVRSNFWPENRSKLGLLTAYEAHTRTRLSESILIQEMRNCRSRQATLSDDLDKLCAQL
jgi:hypothetical protein